MILGFFIWEKGPHGYYLTHNSIKSLIDHRLLIIVSLTFLTTIIVTLTHLAFGGHLQTGDWRGGSLVSSSIIKWSILTELQAI